MALTRTWKSLDIDHITAVLLEKFTPGPITIVCHANSKLPIEFTTKTIGARDRTIGVRIPDSIVERDVASCTNYVNTTVAVRYPKDGTIVQNFEQAIEIISNRIELLGNTPWAAIEGGNFCCNHSTVVQVTDDVEKIKLIREGDIPFDVIKDASDCLSSYLLEDFT
jgi:L-threonylcarbamoyladenylate synthase